MAADRNHRFAVYYKRYESGDAGRSEQASHAHALGRQVLASALKAEYNIDFSEDMITLAAGGKPILKDYPIHFNISHCDGLVACAVSDVPVGIDVEKARKVTDSLIRKACSPGEQAYVADGFPFLNSIPNAGAEGTAHGEKEDRFLQLWTLKESYLKMTGEGMAKPLDQVNFSFKENPKEIDCNQKGNFFQIRLEQEYWLSVCTIYPYEASIAIYNIADKCSVRK